MPEKIVDALGPKIASLQDIVDVLGRRISSSIDFIEDEQAKAAITATLGAIRKLLSASIAEVYCLETEPAPTKAFEPSEKRPFFRRFISVYPEEFSATVRHEKYYPKEMAGYWTWVYENDLEIRIENHNHRTSTGDVPNKTPHSKDVPPEYDIVDESVRGMPVISLIVIPFEHKIENSRGLWGFLDIEFCYPTPFNPHCYERLNKLADHIANVI